MKHKILITLASISIFGISWWLVSPCTLQDYTNFSVIWGVIIALVVYITNSLYQYKQRISENAIRYMEVHTKLFENEFLSENIQAMEDGTFERTAEDEKSFNRLLGEIEHLALMSKSGVVSKTANIYMFGWFARHIQPVLTAEERNNVYWELVVEFLDELKEEADDFYKKTKEQRQEYFEKNHFFH